MKFERVVLVGNSLGGMIAARFASEFPEKVGALVLVAPGGFTPHTPISRFRQVCGLALIFE
ncbi:MAG: alpha/beta fold hydrolase [Proteobacteria bacterium]|nr:alpha/beta fold hydrolase [Pseudomonadota bacterium]